MRRTLALFFTSYLLWALVSQINHEISGWRVSLFFGGLFVVFPALRLKRNEGLLVAFASGLLFDVNAPIWFGCHALLFSAAYLFVFHFRSRVPREESLIGAVIALLANLGIFLGISFGAFRDLPVNANIWPRLLTDLLISQVFLASIAPWFLALQARALEIAGVDLRAEHRGMR